MDKTEESKSKRWFQGLKEKAEQAIEQAQSFTAHVRADATKALESLLRKAWENQKELRILVTGKTGQGKSSLINGMLGAKVAVEGAGADRCTTDVKMYCKCICGVPVKAFDSPGLQDRSANEEEYIQGMKEKCGELSLVLYCTKMINTRLTDDDKHAMVKLTEAFGEKFWEYAVFVLTFANMENCERKDDRDEDIPEPAFNDDEGWKKLKKQRFEGRLKIWKEEIKKFLITEVGVNPDIVNRIPVVPTGDYKITPSFPNPYILPDRDDWFNKFWEACCLRVKETRLFLEINKDRMVTEDANERDDEGTAAEQNEHDQESKEDEEKRITEELDICTATNNSMELEKSKEENYHQPKPTETPILECSQECESKPIGTHSDSEQKYTSTPKKDEEKNVREKRESIKRYQQARKSFIEMEKQQTNNLPLIVPRKRLTQEFSESIDPQQQYASSIPPHHEEKALEDYGIPKRNIHKINLSIPSDTLTPSAINSKSLRRLTRPASLSELHRKPTPTQGAEPINPAPSVETHPIYITDAFAKEMAIESVRRGFGESVADACRAAFNNIAKPAKWLMKFLKK